MNMQSTLDMMLSARESERLAAMVRKNKMEPKKMKLKIRVQLIANIQQRYTVNVILLLHLVHADYYGGQKPNFFKRFLKPVCILNQEEKCPSQVPHVKMSKSQCEYSSG